jgi:hypothetical protein
MPRAKTPSYVAEFEVQTTPKDRRVLRSRLEAGRQLYNAVLSEALWRLSQMRQDPGFELAKALPRGASGEKATALQKVQAKVRRDAFAALRVKHRFQEYDLHKHVSLAETCWLRGHLDVHTEQKVASRAFKSAERWSFAASGKPRFKRYGELESLEGKSNAAGIRFRTTEAGGDRIHWGGSFAKLSLPLVVVPGDEVHAHSIQAAREGRVKYSRLLLRTIRGEERVFIQLVLEGQALRKNKHPVRQGRVGLDMGPSQVAVVTEGHAEIIPFCPGLDRKEAARRRYLRKLDRQRRANNPENFRENGTVKPRSQRKRWESSERQDATRAVLQETLRAMAAQRKSLQGQVVHQVLALGNEVVTEKVNKRAWAKLWGRSVGHKAPGMFETRLAIVAGSTGGSMEQVPTRTTYMSSRCLCGKRTRKELKERKHTCGCEFIPAGMHADRDEFSAFLAFHCQGGVLDEQAARKSWLAWGAECLLRSSSSVKETANGEALPSLRGQRPRRSGSISNGPKQRREAGGGKARTGERRVGFIPLKAHQPRMEQEGTHVA